MKFSLATAALVSLLQITNALPAEPRAELIAPVEAEDFSDDTGNSTSLDNRGLFTKYPCKQALRLKFFKSQECDGKATRTDIYNWPLPNIYMDKCQDITSKTDMLAFKAYTDSYSLYISYYSEPGCSKKSAQIAQKESSMFACNAFYKKKDQDKPPAIKSFKMTLGVKDEKCMSNYESGIPGDGKDL